MSPPLKTQAPTFREALESARRAPVDIAKAALCLARDIALPRLDIKMELARLDIMAAGFERPGFEAAQCIQGLNAHFFQTLEFGRDMAGGGDLGSEFFHTVSSNRLGSPLGLSMVYQSIAWRIGLPLKIVELPGCILLRFNCSEDENAIFINLFEFGRLYTFDETIDLLEHLDDEFAAHPERLAPTSVDDLLYNYLSRIESKYRRKNNVVKMLRVKKLQCELTAATGADWVTRAELESKMGRQRTAADSLTTAYLKGVTEEEARGSRRMQSRLARDFAKRQ